MLCVQAWTRLASEALRQGNVEIVELAFQTTKALDKLSFLYLITGNDAKLAKMLAIAGMRGDTASRFHNALYAGSAEERMKGTCCWGRWACGASYCPFILSITIHTVLRA